MKILFIVVHTTLTKQHNNQISKPENALPNNDFTLNVIEIQIWTKNTLSFGFRYVSYDGRQRPDTFYCFYNKWYTFHWFYNKKCTTFHWFYNKKCTMADRGQTFFYCFYNRNCQKCTMGTLNSMIKRSRLIWLYLYQEHRNVIPLKRWGF